MEKTKQNRKTDNPGQFSNRHFTTENKQTNKNKTKTKNRRNKTNRKQQQQQQQN